MTVADRITFAAGGVSTSDDAGVRRLGPGEFRIVGGPRLLPVRLRLGTLRDARLRLLAPLDVAISEEGGQIVAEVESLNEYGWGENLGDAVADLQRAIAELYYSLEADRDRLGADLQRTWETLERVIRRA